MERSEALKLIEENVKNKNLVRHMLAVEAIMKGLATFLGEDEAFWGLTGLLHDVDFEKTSSNPAEHGILAGKILKGKIDEKVLKAIKAHNFDHTGVKPESKMEKALIAADSVSGLIVACALVMPSRKLSEVKLKTLKKKFKDKDFARGSNRDRILMCEAIGIPKDKFLEIALESLKGIGSELNL